MYPKRRPSGGESHESDVEASPHFPSIEREVLAFWDDDKTFQASIDQREGAAEWVVYDGPPFANGLPHYGHLLTGYAKDVFPRFQTMRGKQVHRRFGWDTHGLPAELEAERQLGITDKAQIESMGIAAFNDVARESVLRYTREWRDYVTRQARWVDFDNGYKTFDTDFVESVIWAFKALYDKGLAYEGHRVLPYCWRDQTPLSNHELRMDDDVYQQRQDQAVTVTFPLVGARAESLDLAGVRALAWTTTPWTLPTNVALVVGPEIEYAIVSAGPLGASDSIVMREGGVSGVSGVRAEYLLGADLLGNYAKDLGYETVEDAQAAVSRTIRGDELHGLQYERLWDYYADVEAYETQNAWQIVVDDYVSTKDGTGIVHVAPAYGEEDHRICERVGIPVLVSVDDSARFLPLIDEVAGLHVFDANKPLIRSLARHGRLFRQASYVHSYPHCWRCRNPLIYKAVSSWFIRVPEFRDRMGELNRDISWVPANVRDGQFGKWIGNARDWSVSRNRFWGSPIPVWKSDNPDYPRVDVYGSLDELERDFGVRPADLHRPYIDELTRPNPDDPSGQSTMRRIPDVLDVWFDSGSMPFAQVHYPFENREWFDTHHPADFIVEYIGQTRGWFYTLHVLSSALFDRPAFRHAISHGIVLGTDGQKMSKSLRNYPDVNDVFDRDGSDAMRWFLMSSPILRGGNLVVTEEGIREGVRQVLLPLWSTWYFFSLYANASNYEARRRTDSDNVLDRYLLAKTRSLIDGVTHDLEAFDSPFAAAKLRDFADVLTNWYVRRSRERFWQGVEADTSNRDAFDTLYTVLETVTRLTAPLLPLISEQIWQGLTGERSVHLTEWPQAAEFREDTPLVVAMDHVRAISSSVLALRKQAALRVRLPLAGITVVTQAAENLASFESILRDELNIKLVRLVELTDSSVTDYGITRRLTVNARVAGPRLGKDVQNVIRAARHGEWAEVDGVVVAAGIPLIDGEYDVVLETVSESSDQVALALIPGGGFVLLDTATTPELELEGHARDFIRDIQQARRSAGLHVSDRIDLRFVGDTDIVQMVEECGAVIASETLATSLTANSADTLQDGDPEVWPNGHVVHFKANTWGATNGGHFELRLHPQHESASEEANA